MPGIFNIGAPGSVSGASGGKVKGFNNVDSVVPVQVLGASGERQIITFHNPGSVDILVFPTTQANGSPNTPTIASPGGGFRVFGNGGSLVVSGECQQAWNALAYSGTNQPLTVMQSNVL